MNLTLSDILQWIAGNRAAILVFFLVLGVGFALRILARDAESHRAATVRWFARFLQETDGILRRVHIPDPLVNPQQQTHGGQQPPLNPQTQQPGGGRHLEQVIVLAQKVIALRRWQSDPANAVQKPNDEQLRPLIPSMGELRDIMRQVRLDRDPPLPEVREVTPAEQSARRLWFLGLWAAVSFLIALATAGVALVILNAGWTVATVFTVFILTWPLLIIGAMRNRWGFAMPDTGAILHVMLGNTYHFSIRHGSAYGFFFWCFGLRFAETLRRVHSHEAQFYEKEVDPSTGQEKKVRDPYQLSLESFFIEAEQFKALLTPSIKGAGAGSRDVRIPVEYKARFKVRVADAILFSFGTEDPVASATTHARSQLWQYMNTHSFADALETNVEDALAFEVVMRLLSLGLVFEAVELHGREVVTQDVDENERELAAPFLAYLQNLADQQKAEGQKQLAAAKPHGEMAGVLRGAREELKAAGVSDDEIQRALVLLTSLDQARSALAQTTPVVITGDQGYGGVLARILGGSEVFNRRREAREHSGGQGSSPPSTPNQGDGA